MELVLAPVDIVGKTVKKEFEGFGLYSGVVKSYDSASGFFEIEYEDGDSEELDFSEVSLLLEGKVQLVGERFRRGRKPKKRRRVENNHQIGDGARNAGENLVTVKVNSQETLEMGSDISGACSKYAEESCCLNLNDECAENLGTRGGLAKKNGISKASLNLTNFRHVTDNDLGDGCRFVADLEGKLGVGNFCDGFDLNAGLNFNERMNAKFAIDLPVSSNGILNSKRRDIDLNLDVNGDNDEDLNRAHSADGNERRQCDFDLNMECDDGMIYALDGRDGEDEASTSVGMVEDSRNKEGESFTENCLETGTANEILQEVRLDIKENEAVESSDVHPNKVFGVESTVGVEQMKKEYCVSAGDVTANTFGTSDSNIIENSKLVQIELKDGLSEINISGPCDYQVNSESYSKQRNSRKRRRKLSNDLAYTSERVLRRSTRSGSSQNQVFLTPLADHDRSASPVVSVVTEEKQVTLSCKGFENSPNLPSRLELPPSSKNLNLDDIPILDLFSIYACLRSFSTLLFLSPFELEDFVAALKCKTPCTLFDYVHVAVLQALRKHLEYLSSEGSESASSCLRSLNWDFLDLITWPMFMVEYLVIHGSGLRPGLRLSQLNLFQNDYYKQSTPLKVEILRCLCDDMIEAEAIRSEINRRSLAYESETVLDRSTKFEVYKKRKSYVDVSGGSCLTDEILDDTTDWNSDECCLCKMDGSLICCDGCPAAYHTKCVGIANDCLPDGDWYCPECAIDRCKPWIKSPKSLRGAELLGIDLHGRLYFCSAGYLLVSDSINPESSFHYYHRNDLDVVIEALRSSYIWYSAILMAIYKNWNVPSKLDREEHKVASHKPAAAFSEKIPNGEYPVIAVSTEPLPISNKDTNTEKPEEDSVARTYGFSDFAGAEATLDSISNSEDLGIKLEESAIIAQANVGVENLPTEKPSSIPSGDVSSLIPSCLDVEQEMNTESTVHGHTFSAITINSENMSMEEKIIDYVNLYHFAQSASLVAELICSPCGKMSDVSLSEEEITAAQIKAILKRTTKFHWPIIHHIDLALQKEQCGWCHHCKSSEDKDCLFNMNVGPIVEDVKFDVANHLPNRYENGHLKYVVHKLLSIEDRLQGLLLGPWLNPHQTKIWRESILKAPDLTSVKHFLFTLEANLHPRAISAEWFKHIDSVVTLGSALHFMDSSLRASSRHGFGRKRGRYSDIDSNSSSNPVNGLGMLWWRGGRLSRQMFNWKILPTCMTSRAARQAGCAKIRDILYLEGSESAKRSRRVSWLAAVEASTSVEQLAMQVRELDTNIKWDDIENTHPLPTMDVESRKSIRLFKKVIIRRKCIEQNIVKYLLDFGKRRAIPDVVKKHGTTFEEASGEKKRYWLEETYVPLHLLKNFEEKRIARKTCEVKSRKAFETHRENLKSLKKKGFAYLFLRAEKSEFCQCGHCNKDVPVREAVSCQSCKGFFHKRHVRKSSGSISSELTYICYKCSNCTSLTKGEMAKIGMQGMKMQLKKCKKANSDHSLLQSKNKKRVGRPIKSHKKKKIIAGVPLRRSARKAKFLFTQKKKPHKKAKPKKGRKIISKKGGHKKPKSGSAWQKKRSKVFHSYWLNGLHLSRKPNDGRVLHFREKTLLASSQNSAILDQPKCHLCLEPGYSPACNYVACEICGGWFHGDAFGLDSNKIDKLIGFRCHLCCKRNPPPCRNWLESKADVPV